MTAPVSRTLPVLALWMAALRLGLAEPRKRRRPAKQLPLLDRAPEDGSRVESTA